MSDEGHTGDRRDGGDEAAPVLEVNDLTKIYNDGTLAVDDIDFTVRQGDFCVLIGPSGCGKTTTLHSIVGKVTPTDGRIVMDGTEITDVPIEERDIGLVFQDFQLFPHLSVEQNVRYGLERMAVPAQEIEARTDRILDLLRLSDVRDRAPSGISAGQQQRVALARSLVLEPSVLLLDEPLGDLDYKLQKFMEREFLRIHRELDTTFVYVTHDQNQAMRLGNRIVVMNDGRIEQTGTVDEVYNSPATAFVATFVGDTNVFSGELSAADNGRATVETPYGTFVASTANLRTSAENLLGDEIIFAVRPQHIALTADAENDLSCTVADVIYRPGRGTQLLLNRGQDSETRAKELTVMVYDRVSVSAKVTIGWEPEDAILLDEVSVAEDVDLETDILGE
jgi:ABC-type Fe3+/spermidine/putrescine transport system ATPase subunit